jgi:hypothetical protein
MDALVKQLVRELSDAIAAAVGEDARVEACREKARAAGLDFRVSLDAVIQVVNRSGTAAGHKGHGANGKKAGAKSAFEMSANDRRFLKSLRISADEPTEKVE